MAEQCVYCAGMVICDDDATCVATKSHGELVGNGYKHKGCFCIGVVGGLPKLVECGTGSPEQILSIYLRGNRIKIIEVSACP